MPDVMLMIAPCPASDRCARVKPSIVYTRKQNKTKPSSVKTQERT